MKKIWQILCIPLLITLGVAIPIAYKMGLEKEQEDIWAFAAFYQSERDLATLADLQSNRPSDGVARLEQQLWESVLTIHTYREELFRPDELLQQIALYFKDHEIMSANLDVITPERLDEIAEEKWATDPTTNLPEHTATFKRWNHIAVSNSLWQTRETKKILLEYLENSDHDPELVRLGMNRHFFCLTFSAALSEFAVAHEERLPNSMDELVEWYNKENPDVNWEAEGLSEDADVAWGRDVSDLNWDNSWEKPPQIIKFQTDFFREQEEFANRRFIESLVSDRRGLSTPPKDSGEE